MRSVRTRDTAPEMALRRGLFAAGARGWRVAPKGIPGKPDLVWQGRRLAVFVDGAFWHGHPDHYWGQSGDFWDKKIEANRARDQAINKQLEADGWAVLRFWDFEIERELEFCISRVAALLDCPRLGR